MTETGTAPPPALPTEALIFGLPEKRYHESEALGSHAIQRLAIEPVEFWWESAMNPLREQEEIEKEDLLVGRAYHKLVLEGREAFDAAFCAEPDPADFPGALVTNRDMQAWLRERQLKVSGDKAELIARCKAADPDAPIWEEIEAKWVAGRTPIKWRAYQRILLSAATITRNPDLARCFEDGWSEVSVFWLEDGVPNKARIDYLKLLASVDLKSIGLRSLKSFATACKREIAQRRYDIQFVHYTEAREQARKFVEAGKVYVWSDAAGAVPIDKIAPDDPLRRMAPPMKWLRVFARQADYTWSWVFVKKTGAPIAWACGMSQDDPLFGLASEQRLRALDTWRENMARYGREMWIYTAPFELITGQDLPTWLGQD
ncbi:MAG: SAP domain-containing protein [Bacteroidota bacterium]